MDPQHVGQKVHGVSNTHHQHHKLHKNDSLFGLIVEQPKILEKIKQTPNIHIVQHIHLGGALGLSGTHGIHHMNHRHIINK
jgi:hypothetical protein